MDQKTGGELGVEKITLVSLITLPNMELSQPLSLKNSGPESKLIVSIKLKVCVILIFEVLGLHRDLFSGDGTRPAHGRTRNRVG